MKTKTPAVSPMTGNFKKAYCRTIEFQNEAGTDTLLEVSPSCSFDGRQWHTTKSGCRSMMSGATTTGPANGKTTPM
jgi:hypothetical protein